MTQHNQTPDGVTKSPADGNPQRADSDVALFDVVRLEGLEEAERRQAIKDARDRARAFAKQPGIRKKRRAQALRIKRLVQLFRSLLERHHEQIEDEAQLEGYRSNEPLELLDPVSHNATVTDSSGDVDKDGELVGAGQVSA